MTATNVLRRKPKIIATIGPSSSSEETILCLIKSGADAFRLNFSHSNPETHLRILAVIRKLEEQTGRLIPVIQDLPGPKMRIGKVPGDEVYLKKGDRILLSTSATESDQIITVNVPDFEKMVKSGERIYLGDGEIELEVVQVKGAVETVVHRGGILRSGKGITLSVSQYLPSLTDLDREYLKIGVNNDFDYIALSYVQRPEDIMEAKALINESGKDIGILAKIERCEALEHIEEITRLADGLIVARGDLGVVLPLVKIPYEQQRIIKTAIKFAKPVFVATQMLSSMVEHERPTRAEVTDVTQAVVDGADGILLSEETAVGKYPVETVEWADKILSEAEKSSYITRISPEQKDVNEIISYHAVEIARGLNVKVIVTPTSSGSTTRRIVKFRPSISVIALVPEVKIARRLNLLYGTISMVNTIDSVGKMERIVYELVSESQEFTEEDLVMFLWGYPFEKSGITNTIAIRKVANLPQDQT